MKEDSYGNFLANSSTKGKIYALRYFLFMSSSDSFSQIHPQILSFPFRGMQILGQ